MYMNVGYVHMSFSRVTCTAMHRQPKSLCFWSQWPESLMDQVAQPVCTQNTKHLCLEDQSEGRRLKGKRCQTLQLNLEYLSGSNTLMLPSAQFYTRKYASDRAVIRLYQSVYCSHMYYTVSNKNKF